MSSSTSHCSPSPKTSMPDSSATCAPASMPAAAPSSPAMPRPSSAPILLPSSTASSRVRLLRCSTSSSPSSCLYTASASMTRTVSLLRRRSSSAITSPWKFGSTKPSTISWTGPIAMDVPLLDVVSMSKRCARAEDARLLGGELLVCELAAVVQVGERLQLRGAAVRGRRCVDRRVAGGVAVDRQRVVARPRDDVDERPQERHEDDTGHPQGLGPAAQVGAPEDVGQRECPKHDHGQEDQEEKEVLPKAVGKDHREPPSIEETTASSPATA